MFDPKQAGYKHVEQSCCTHRQFGGVTTTRWRFVLGRRDDIDPTITFSISRMTAGLYERYLQTALDDTIGPTPGRRQLDTGSKLPKGLSDEVVGLVDKQHKVVDGSGLAPDLSLASAKESIIFGFSLYRYFLRRKFFG